MGNIIYKPLIEDMTWSYSRIEAFEMCPNKFFTRYILGIKEDDMFYASYGNFIHKLLFKYYSKGLSKSELLVEFLTNFSTEVRGGRPKGNIVSNYIKQGADFLREMHDIPFEPIAIEEKLNFSIGNKQFTGIIDFLGKSEEGLVIVDHKSRDLKPRSKRSKPTQNDLTIDKMLRQLYIYSAAVKDKYGEFPTKLCFNCFRTGTFIEEAFDINKYNETIEWALGMIDTIENTEDFTAEYDYFKCWNICGCHDRCDEFIYQIED